MTEPRGCQRALYAILSWFFPASFPQAATLAVCPFPVQRGLCGRLELGSQPCVWLCGLRQNIYLLQCSPCARLHTLLILSSSVMSLPTISSIFLLPQILLALFEAETDVHITCILAHSKSIQGNGKNAGGTVLC